MAEKPGQQFEPVRRNGNLFHLGVLLFLISCGIGILWLALNKAQGSLFVSLMILLLIVIIVLPVVIYRAYSLLNARYIVERDGLRLRWGLRLEDIPSIGYRVGSSCQRIRFPSESALTYLARCYIRLQKPS